MRRLVHALSGLTLALLLAGTLPLRAAEPARPAPANDAYAQGLLWQIERDGRAPSYLFGTIHLSDPRITTLPEPVQRAFDRSRHFIMEMVPDAAGLAVLARAMTFTDARTLAEVVGAATYADVRTAFQRRGMPAEAIAKYKPWAVAVILSLPAIDGVPLDMQLQHAAQAQGKTVEGLETAQEQVAVFDELTLDDQRALLDVALREQQMLERQVEAMVQAYMARDLGRLRALAEKQLLDEGALRDTVMRRLLVERNRRMVERMQPRLEQGPTFVAIGAAHLPGADGVLALLARRGYRSRAIY